MRAVAFALVLVGFAGSVCTADEKVDAKKLIGKWEPAKADKGPKMVLEIQDKGKLELSVTFGEKTEKVEGKYTVDGNKMTVELTFMGEKKKETMTIVKLTDTELVTKDEKGNEEALKKVK